MMQFLNDNLQRWTPFAVLVLLTSGICGFVIVYDTIYSIAYPYYIVALLTLMLGGTGASSLISHGVKVANGVAKDTASATVTAMASTTQQNSAALSENTAATQANTAMRTSDTQNSATALVENTVATEANTAATKGTNS